MTIKPAKPRKATSPRTGIYLNEETAETLDALCEDLGYNRSAMIRELITDYARRYPPQLKLGD